MSYATAEKEAAKATSNIERVLTVFAGISAGDVGAATQYIDHTRFVQHNPYSECWGPALI